LSRREYPVEYPAHAIAPAQSYESAHLFAVGRVGVSPHIVEDLLSCAVTGQPDHRDELADSFLDMRFDCGTAVEM